MTTSQETSFLSKPTDDERIPLSTLAYFRARNRNRVYDAVIAQFLESAISQATLARRLGKRPEVVSRLLGAPGNWTLDTVSDLLFATSGAEAQYDIAFPLDAPARNMTRPEWLDNPEGASRGERRQKPAVSPPIQPSNDNQETT